MPMPKCMQCPGLMACHPCACPEGEFPRLSVAQLVSQMQKTAALVSPPPRPESDCSAVPVEAGRRLCLA
ncbi:MAG TPA: hypothetical protein PKY77_02765 [Phycisphaerae bacterium]|nr:hypothetical protein [Phycisphaerae bacterium]HRY66667.1 hypothetical protein [Phycisphaerae bacterium]HSA27630.1 hypothetical protein [Phycisphaerae bacterium]